MKKILIAAPTSANKNYCLEDYLMNVSKIEYPNWKCVLFDNTTDEGENAKHINDTMKRLFGNDDRFLAIRSDIWGCAGVISRVCKGHNDAREYAISNNYSAMLHLETDVFPAPHVLQELILRKKDVVNCPYYRDEGRFRKIMVQKKLHRAPNNIYSYNLDPFDDVDLMAGGLKEVSHAGLGCCLISKKVLEKIPFRYVQGIHSFPDSWWAQDLYTNKIKIWLDTDLPPAIHKNSNWQLDVFSKTSELPTA